MKLVLSLLYYHRSTIIPFSVTLLEYAPIALAHLSCHILCVKLLCDKIEHRISSVVAEARMATIQSSSYDLTRASTASPAFDVFSQYILWLRANSTELVEECYQKELLSCVDKALLEELRKEAYSTQRHLLSTYWSKYRFRLAGIALPLSTYSRADVNQVLFCIAQFLLVLCSRCLMFW